MKTVPSLSDIYANKVLVTEAEVKAEDTATPIETDTQAITESKKATKDNVVTKKADIGNGKDKKLVGDGPTKVKLRDKAKTEKRSKFETMESYNTFEKLFRSTLSENTTPETTPSQSLDFEVPVSPEELTDEIESTEDEVSNLVTDLKDVVSKLNDILSKIESESSEEETEEETGKEELELPEDDNVDTANKVKESVEAKGHALTSKKNVVVKGNPKVHGGKPQTGNVDDEPEPKPLKADDKDLVNTKTLKVKTSNIKAGDFFK